MTERIASSTATPADRQTPRGIFRHADGVIPNILAITYALAGYCLALVLLTRSGMLFVGGVFLLAHSLTIAAYLIHECTHGSLFSQGKPGSRDLHRNLATVLAWLTGACLGDPARITDKHMRHHFDRADIVAVDYREILNHRLWLKKAVEIGQWLCLPAVEVLMHTFVILRPLRGGGSRAERKHLFLVGGCRILFFTVLFVIAGWQLLVGYAIAYLIFLTVLGFMDAFQHQYLLLKGLEVSRRESPTRDSQRFGKNYFTREYEDSHTFSNLISERWPVLNLLVLNFCYHNVHHQHPREPWYRLPKLHRDNVGKVQVVPLASQLRDFFRYRVTRVMAPADDRLGTGENTGAAGVSFLTPL